MLRKHNSAAAFQSNHPKIHKGYTYKADVSEFTDIFTTNTKHEQRNGTELHNEKILEILKIQAVCLNFIGSAGSAFILFLCRYFAQKRETEEHFLNHTEIVSWVLSLMFNSTLSYFYGVGVD